MDYITKLYKNRAETLMEEVKRLESILEGMTTNPILATMLPQNERRPEEGDLPPEKNPSYIGLTHIPGSDNSRGPTVLGMQPGTAMGAAGLATGVASWAQPGREAAVVSATPPRTVAGPYYPPNSPQRPAIQSGSPINVDVKPGSPARMKPADASQGRSMTVARRALMQNLTKFGSPEYWAQQMDIRAQNKNLEKVTTELQDTASTMAAPRGWGKKAETVEMKTANLGAAETMRGARQMTPAAAGVRSLPGVLMTTGGLVNIVQDAKEGEFPMFGIAQTATGLGMIGHQFGRAFSSETNPPSLGELKPGELSPDQMRKLSGGSGRGGVGVLPASAESVGERLAGTADDVKAALRRLPGEAGRLATVGGRVAGALADPALEAGGALASRALAGAGEIAGGIAMAPLAIDLFASEAGAGSEMPVTLPTEEELEKMKKEQGLAGTGELQRYGGDVQAQRMSPSEAEFAMSPGGTRIVPPAERAAQLRASNQAADVARRQRMAPKQ